MSSDLNPFMLADWRRNVSAEYAAVRAGVLRAVTSAVRSRIFTDPWSTRCSRCSASRSGLNGPGGSGRDAWTASCFWNASRPWSW